MKDLKEYSGKAFTKPLLIYNILWNDKLNRSSHLTKVLLPIKGQTRLEEAFK